MKNNGITNILNWVLLVGAVALLVCGFKYYNKSKTVRSYSGVIEQFRGLQNNEALVRGLVAETVEYAKTNPAINPVLDSIMNKPAAKPATAPTAPRK